MFGQIVQTDKVPFFIYLTERIEKLLNKIYQILQNEVKANVVAYLDVFDPF